MFWAQFRVTKMQGFLVGFLPRKFLRLSIDLNEFGLRFVPLEVNKTLLCYVVRTPAGSRAISLVQNVQAGSAAHPVS